MFSVLGQHPKHLKDVLNIAGGFDDPVYRKTIRDDKIVVIRKDETQFYGSEFEISYNTFHTHLDQSNSLYS